nr:tRNA-uridine aminocarboxypropyltransferase [Aestuariibacter sp. A3R04]
MRAVCKQCLYPLTTCLCSDVAPVMSPIPILILQHKKEVGHAKNTVRLLSLSLKNLTVITHDNHAVASQALSALLSKYRNPAVVYPTIGSLPIEQLKGHSKHDAYILLDGSWRQSRGMWLAYPDLHPLPHYHFTDAGSSNYVIRHTKMEQGLSTLEAVAYTLTQTTTVDTSILYRLQAAMQKNWRGPQHHLRKRKDK